MTQNIKTNFCIGIYKTNLNLKLLIKWTWRHLNTDLKINILYEF